MERDRLVPPAPRSLDALRACVAADPQLAVALSRVGRDAFAAELVRRAAELGYDLTPADVERALRSAQQAWLQRWIR